MKTRALILLLLSSSLSWSAFGQDKTGVSGAEAAACGPMKVRFDVTADKSQHPTPTPESGKALIYVVQTGFVGRTRIGADGKWLAGLRRGGYFSASIDPGEHHLCAVAHHGQWNLPLGPADQVYLYELNAKAGETYYFVAHVGRDGFALSQVNADEGKYVVGQANFNASRPK